MSTKTLTMPAEASAPAAPERTPVALVGNLTRDPEVKQSGRGTTYVTVGLAVDEPGPNGWSDKATTFYELVVFDDLARHAVECIHKGDRVLVAGRQEDRTWIDQEGQERTEHRVTLDDLGPSLRWASASVRRVSRADKA
ncbi:MAG: single-stranded DNA-binding protein [Acidimicrobiales bacterium]